MSLILKAESSRELIHLVRSSPTYYFRRRGRLIVALTSKTVDQRRGC